MQLLRLESYLTYFFQFSGNADPLHELKLLSRPADLKLFARSVRITGRDCPPSTRRRCPSQRAHPVYSSLLAVVAAVAARYFFPT